MKNKKIIYLGLIASIILSFTAYLFYKKSLQLKSEAVVKDLRAALLSYIEKEEVYPKDLKKIVINKRSLEVTYEVLEEGRGCRFQIENKVFELWDEER